MEVESKHRGSSWVKTRVEISIFHISMHNIGHMLIQEFIGDLLGSNMKMLSIRVDYIQIFQ